jgi:hypothetical protein
LPTGPPTLRRAEAALEMTGPAAAVAFERPSVALEAAWPALLAASEVVEECLTTVRRVRNCDCRRTARVAAGILGTARGEGAETRSRSQITQDIRWWEEEEVQLAGLVCRNDGTRICGLGRFRKGGHVSKQCAAHLTLGRLKKCAKNYIVYSFRVLALME